MKGGEGYPVPHPVYPPSAPLVRAKVMCSLCVEELSGFPYPGPATVRMVSSNGPPVPMPMQVPPGHMVQQIVDEHGILTHVILSPQPTAMPTMSTQTMAGDMSNGYHHHHHHHHPQYYPPGPYPAPHYPGSPGPQYPSHHPHPHPHTQQPHPHPHPAAGHGPHHHHHHHQPGAHHTPSHVRSSMAPPPPPQPPSSHSVQSPPPPPAHHSGHGCSGNHNHHQHHGSHHHGGRSSGASPPLNSSDDRTMRQRNRVRKKIQQRLPPSEGYYSQSGHHNTGRRRGGGRVNGDIHPANGNHGNGHTLMGSEPAQPQEDDSHNLIAQCLSSIPPPKVTDIESKCALIELSPPDWESFEVEVDPRECQYELLLSDKGRDAKYKRVFCGDATEITLNDLKPGIEYHLRVSASLSEALKGSLTEAANFRTLPCEPECPPPPKLMNKTKTSLSLKWNAACENGSKISTYSLEWDQGQGDDSFVEVYNGLNRQYRVNQLTASTRYLFRLAAINAVGKSGWSETATFFTSGSVPPQPDPPMLCEQFVHSLTVSWIKRPNEDEFRLQMEDEATGLENSYGIWKEDSSIVGVICCAEEVGRNADESYTGHGFIPVYNGPSLSHTLKQLRRNTQYKFRLATKNDEGLSKWSDAVMFKTLPDKPAAPCKPQMKGRVCSRTFRITWEPPTDDGGCDITKFIVELDDGQGFEVVYEGKETEHQFEQLTPGHQYRVRVACCSAGGKSEFSDCCMATTQPVAPGPCQPPKLQGKPKATSLHLRWSYPDYDGGSPVTQFAVQMMSPDRSAREVYRGPDLDCIVASLMPGKTYLFQVHSFNRAGAGPWSEMLEVISGAGAPDAPRSPQLTCRSPHSALVTWEEPANNGAAVSEYRLEWTQTPDAQDFSQLYVGPSVSYEAKGLTPATSYSFRVQALNTAGAGPYSPTAQCHTPPSSPGPVMSVRWQPGPTSIHLSWRQPPCNGSDLVSYNITLSDKQVLSVEPVSEYTLENLQPETTYRIRVQAVNGIGVGPYSTTAKVTTRPLPPSPPHLECVSGAANSLKLKWGDGRNPDVLRYTLEMEKEDGSYQAVYTGPAHSHKVNRLSESTSYQFRIFASNDAGQGPYSDTFTFTTTKAPPPALKAPRVVEVGESECEVEWTGCVSQGSDSLTYVLQLQQPHSAADHHFKQVYKGSDRHHKLQGLEQGTQYQIRVYAIREIDDGSSPDLPGPFSPTTPFTTTTPNSTTTSGPVEGKGDADRSVRKVERTEWSDQQWAAVILIAFVVLAVVVAIVTQQVIAYVGDSSAPPPVSAHPDHSSTAQQSH